jgi:hypothetical protein
MKFDCILNKYLAEYNVNPIEGIMYEQFNIVEKKGYYYLLHAKENKIKGSAKSMQQAKELVNTINSGC